MIDLTSHEVVNKAPRDLTPKQDAVENWPRAIHPVYGPCAVQVESGLATYYTLSRLGPDNKTHGPFKCRATAFDYEQSGLELELLQYNVLQNTAAPLGASLQAPSGEPMQTDVEPTVCEPTAPELKRPSAKQRQEASERATALTFKL